MRKVYRTLMTLLVGLTVLTSCNKEMFDQKIYDEIVNTTFPIEPVDASHTWTTTTRRSIVVNVNGKLGEMEKLQVLTADPSSSSSTPQIMAEEKNPVEGRSYTMLYIAPVAHTDNFLCSYQDHRRKICCSTIQCDCPADKLHGQEHCQCCRCY